VVSRVVFLLLFLATGAAVRPAVAQRELYIVRGYVKDTEGAALPGVEVIMESPRRIGRTDPRGYFLLDSVPAGKRRLTARRIGYLAVSPVVLVPQLETDTLEILLMQMAQQLDPVEVTLDREGLYGVVGDTGYRALPGTLVEVLGARLADTTDEQGRFGFDGLKQRHYVLRVSRPGYYGRMFSVDFSKGRELSIFLTRYKEGDYDWANSREAAFSLPDLATRLAMEPKRYRMTREELNRYGSMMVCDIPRIRALYPRGRGQMGEEPNIILRGSIWWRNASLCSWTADQLDLVEWGRDPCSEAWKSIAAVLNVWCGPQRQSSLYAQTPGVRKPYVVVWPRS
jgi:hypothetical protein